MSEISKIVRLSPQGPSGPQGATVLNGAGAPSNGSGANGDFYIDTTNTRLYGPKSSGAWPGGYVSLIGATGAAGAAVLNGAGAPSNGSGSNGDFYVDTTNTRLYGPKASGAWPGGYVSLIGTAGSDATVTQANMQAALEDPAAFRDELDAESTSIAFFTDFESTAKYPTSSFLMPGDLPMIGPAFDLNLSPTTGLVAPIVTGQAYGASDSALFYLGTTVPRSGASFSFGAEFAVGEVPSGVGVAPFTLNMSFSGREMIQSASIAYSAASATGIFTSVAHGLTTGKVVVLRQTANHGLTDNLIYYAIRLDADTFKLATTSANASAGTAITVSSNGTGLAGSGGILPSGSMHINLGSGTVSQLNYYQELSGAIASGNIITRTDHRYVTGDKIKITTVGSSGLTLNGSYWVIVIDANTFRIATSLANALAGTATSFTNPGNFEWQVDDVEFLNRSSAAQTFNALGTWGAGYNHRLTILIHVTGDIMTLTLGKIGSISYRSPHLLRLLDGEEIHCWWESGGSTAAAGKTFCKLHKIWADAPILNQRYVSAAFDEEFANKVSDGPSNVRAVRRSVDNLTNVRKAIGGSGQTSINGRNRATGADVWTEGLYQANVDGVGTSEQIIGFAQMLQDTGHYAALSSAAGAETLLRGIFQITSLRPGDHEVYEFMGNLVGAGTKRIRVVRNTTLEVFFDSGTALDGVTGPFTLRVYRGNSTTVSHVVYSTLMINGVAPIVQRYTSNLGYSYFAFDFRTTTADAGGVVLDICQKEVRRVRYPT